MARQAPRPRPQVQAPNRQKVRLYARVQICGSHVLAVVCPYNLLRESDGSCLVLAVVLIMKRMVCFSTGAGFDDYLLLTDGTLSFINGPSSMVESKAVFEVVFVGATHTHLEDTENDQPAAVSPRAHCPSLRILSSLLFSLVSSLLFHSFPSLPFPSLPFPSLLFPSLPFPSLPFPSLPFPSLPFPSPPAQ